MNWIPLHVHSHYSLLDGLSKPKDIAKRCTELGYSSCALTDHGSISGAVDFSKACKKKEIKPILGSELYISGIDSTIHDDTNGPRNSSHLVVLAKNLNGWKSLIKLTSAANSRENFYYKPRLDIERLKQYTGNMIAFSGHPGSALAKAALAGYDVALKLALEYQDIFGKGNFFIEIQKIYEATYPDATIIAQILREVSLQTGIPSVATADSHYINQADAVDHQVLLCSMLKTTMSKVKKAMLNSEEFGLSGFFYSNKFHIPSIEEMVLHHTEEEVDNAFLISDMCEKYDILKQPQLPKFVCPDNLSEIEYLKVLCREGWKKKIAHKGLDENVYRDRVLMELKVIEESNLAGYFLIVQDYVVWAKKQGWLVGPGRGSVGGSILAYLINITTIDPIKYNLLFERFYNAGRNTPGNISLPDIDVDFPVMVREKIVEYLRNKYGHERVTQIATFGTLQGRSAIKEVLRVHEACNYGKMNEIAKCLPQKHTITDQLEEAEETSIIRWTLENDPDLIREYCYLDDKGNYCGEFGQFFEQAARLEGTYKSQGKHAAGVVITPEPVGEVCPMLRDKNNEDELLAGMEMGSLEAIGGVKMDILGTAVLDKLQLINELLRYGKIQTSHNVSSENNNEEEDD